MFYGPLGSLKIKILKTAVDFRNLKYFLKYFESIKNVTLFLQETNFSIENFSKNYFLYKFSLPL